MQDISRLLECVRCLRNQLLSCETVYERALLGLESEAPVSEILMSVEASSARCGLNSALEDLERLRHTSRLSMIGTEIEEGSSISDVGRHWGFSRQMAQRYVKEARTGSWTTSHPMVAPDG